MEQKTDTIESEQWLALLEASLGEAFPDVPVSRSLKPEGAEHPGLVILPVKSAVSTLGGGRVRKTLRVKVRYMRSRGERNYGELLEIGSRIIEASSLEAEGLRLDCTGNSTCEIEPDGRVSVCFEYEWEEAGENEPDFYLSGVLFPIPPENLRVTAPDGMETSFSSGREFVLSAKERMKEIAMTVRLPARMYPFSVYNNFFISPDTFADRLFSLYETGSKIRLICARFEVNALTFDLNQGVLIRTLKKTVAPGGDLMLEIGLLCLSEEEYEE